MKSGSSKTNDRESIFVEIAVNLHLGYALTKRESQRARKNTIDFFQPLLGARLGHVSMDEGERIIRFHFSDGRQLAAFFFGKGSGNILLLVCATYKTTTDDRVHQTGESLLIFRPNEKINLEGGTVPLGGLRLDSVPMGGNFAN